jgi:hypothetical protein
MTQKDLTTLLPDQDAIKRKMSELAVGLYRGQGGASELAKMIGEQATKNAEMKVEAARKRAKAAA